MKRITSSSNACLRAVFVYQIKDISTSDLHKEADTLTPFQKAYYDKAVMFWRIINNCEPQELLMDLLLQGYHNKRQKYSTFSNQTWKELESSVLPIDSMTLFHS